MTPFQLLSDKIANWKSPGTACTRSVFRFCCHYNLNTGAILACVSYPGYDNNRLANQMDTAY